MCIIVDMCVASRVLVSKEDADFSAIKNALVCKKAVMVYGGQLRKEYLKDRTVASIVRVFDQAGIAIAFADPLILADQKKVAALGLCRSNDSHILALARVSGARILCTHDGPLTEDFKKVAIVPRPKGKIYNRAGHIHLLKRKCSHCKKAG